MFILYGQGNDLTIRSIFVLKLNVCFKLRPMKNITIYKYNVSSLSVNPPEMRKVYPLSAQLFRNCAKTHSLEKQLFVMSQRAFVPLLNSR